MAAQHPDETTPLIVLPERLDTAAAQTLRQDLAACTGRARLDASAVTMLGGLAAETLVRHPRPLSLEEPSRWFFADLATLGLSVVDIEQGIDL